VAVVGGIGFVGIFVHRLNLILNGLSYPNIALPPGLPVGMAQNASSFATSYWYVPTIVEWLIVAGVLAFGAFLLTFAVRFLPIQEPEAH
jgi:molybdopterin-containing oxidoreductase family membrane subunit